jgi:long-chain acyl-CoA synthetase
MSTYNFASIIQESAARYPSKIALITPQITLNYSELARRVNQAGHLFLKLGVDPQDRVSILFTNDYRFLEICFGLMSIGAIPVPMNAKLGAETLAYVYRNSGSRVLIFHDELNEKAQSVQQISEASILVRCASVNEHASPVALSYDELLSQQSASLELYPSEERAICFLPYTSGSTGNPKGCRLTHRGQLWNVQSTSQLRGLTDETRVIISLPLYHKNAMTTMKTIFYLGASAVVLPKADPEQIVKAIETHRCTYMTGVPALYRMIVSYLKEHPGFDLTSLRFGICGSSDTPSELLEEVQQLLGIPMYEGYGLTEGGPVVLESREGIQRIGSAGIPVPGCKIRIVDEQENEVGPNVTGELWVNNPGVADGYWNLPEVTARRITPDGWLKTGDAACRDEDGFIYIVGRKDDMMNVGGENVYPKEVENILLKHPLIEDVCVLPIPHEVKGEVPVAVIVTGKGGELKEDEVKQFFIHNGPAYAHPRKVIFVDALPLTGPGKLDRTRLKEQVTQNII